VEVDENMVSTPQGESASTARYPQGYCAKIIAYFETRNARVDAAFVCPYLQTGMHLLDCGCGPGTITVGLAEIVAPGRVVGVDFERGQIEKARALAAERNLTTIDLAVADLFALPFPSHTFDAIFAHAVLQNVGDPMRALKEMHRVLKPGGIIGVRNVDQGSNIYSPTDPLLDQAHALYFKRWKDIGGDPFGARHSRALLREAGFVNTKGSATTECWSTEDGIRSWGELFASIVEAPAFSDHVIAQGWADRPTVERIAAALRAWGTHPDAFWARIYCEAIGWKR
jgi:ubiquinone/menaquinone biosynthesis C-methylase UbiE